jgi:hypothetical protein
MRLLALILFTSFLLGTASATTENATICQPHNDTVPNREQH